MSRELFVGPLCRYFAADDAEAVSRQGGIAAWRVDLATALADRLSMPLDWVDSPTASVERFDTGAHGLDALRLFALYADRTELELPDVVPVPLDLDPHWRTASAANFERSRYGHLVAATLWLPGEFDFTFRCPRPDGAEATFGSLVALRDQLVFLNARTFQGSDEALDAWTELPGSNFVTHARRGLAIVTRACRAALARSLPLVVVG